MAQVTILKVVEGESHLVLRVHLESDGTGELTNYPILRPSELMPPRRDNKPTFRIMQIWCGFVWFDVTLAAGTTAPVPLWTVSRETGPHVDFRSFGGLVDQNVYASPPGETDGVLVLSTNGFAPVGSAGSLVLELRKTNE